jgi:hypothetical protein
LRTKLAFAGEFVLLHVDAGIGRRAVERGNAVDAGEAGIGGADIAAVEQIRAADRVPFGVQPGIRLLAVERRRRIGRKQIGIARDEIVVAVTPIGVGVNGEIARPGIEQQPAFDAAVAGGRCAELGMRLLVASTMPPVACMP